MKLLSASNVTAIMGVTAVAEEKEAKSKTEVIMPLITVIAIFCHAVGESLIQMDTVPLMASKWKKTTPLRIELANAPDTTQYQHA